MGKSNPFSRRKVEHALRFKDIAQVPTLGQGYEQILQALESILGPVAGGASRLSSNVSQARMAALEADPALKAYYETVQGGLQEDAMGLPADVSRRLTEDVRSSQAARGIIDSPVAGIEEAVTLLGGREELKSRRLAQANQLLTSGLIPTTADFMPSTGDMLSSLLGLEELRLKGGLGKAELRLGGYTQMQRGTQEGVNSVLGGVGGILGAI